MPLLRPSQLDSLIEHWTGAELSSPMGDVLTEAKARWRALPGEFADASPDAEHAELVRKLAAGDIDVVDALNRAAALASARTPAGRALLEAARRQVLADCLARLRERGESIVTDVLAPAMADIVTEATPLLPLVDGIDWSQPIRATERQQKAWAAVQRLELRRRHLERLAGLLRVLGATRDLDDRRSDLGPAEWFHRHPELLPVLSTTGEAKPNVSLVVAIVTGAEPAILTAAEVEQGRTDRRKAGIRAIDRQEPERAAYEDAYGGAMVHREPVGRR